MVGAATNSIPRFVLIFSGDLLRVTWVVRRSRRCASLQRYSCSCPYRDEQRRWNAKSIQTMSPSYGLSMNEPIYRYNVEINHRNVYPSDRRRKRRNKNYICPYLTSVGLSKERDRSLTMCTSFIYHHRLHVHAVPPRLAFRIQHLSYINQLFSDDIYRNWNYFLIMNGIQHLAISRSIS
jgi:hypothetical protein